MQRHSMPREGEKKKDLVNSQNSADSDLTFESERCDGAPSGSQDFKCSLMVIAAMTKPARR